MVGKCDFRVDGVAGEGWWKKEVGPNHSLFPPPPFLLVVVQGVDGWFG